MVEGDKQTEEKFKNRQGKEESIWGEEGIKKKREQGERWRCNLDKDSVFKMAFLCLRKPQPKAFCFGVVHLPTSHPILVNTVPPEHLDGTSLNHRRFHESIHS